MVDDFYPCRAPLVSFRSKKAMAAVYGEEAIRRAEQEHQEEVFWRIDYLLDVPFPGGAESRELLT